MKRIQMLNDVKDTDGVYLKGEVRLVTPEKCGYFCGVGWAKDLTGEVPTAELDTSPKELVVSSAKNGTKAAKVG